MIMMNLAIWVRIKEREKKNNENKSYNGERNDEPFRILYPSESHLMPSWIDMHNNGGKQYNILLLVDSLIEFSKMTLRIPFSAFQKILENISFNK